MPSATRPPIRVDLDVTLWIAKPTVGNESSWYFEGPFCRLPTYSQGGSLSSPQCAGVFRRALDGEGVGATWEALNTVVMRLWAFQRWSKRGHFLGEPWGRKWRGYGIKSRHKIYGQIGIIRLYSFFSPLKTQCVCFCFVLDVCNIGLPGTTRC